MDRFAPAASWNLEQSYESRPRALKKNKKTQESTRLPIKTAHGVVQVKGTEVVADSSDEEEEEEEEVKETVEVEVREEPKGPKVPEKRRVLEAKEELAKTASLVNEDPEENIAMTRRMRDLASDHNPTIVKLALLALMAVYKDIIPGYRIRPMAADEAAQKVSKEVKKLRGFESGLLAGYQQYLTRLGTLLRASRKADATATDKSVAAVAVRCACALLAAVPHFNFRSELLKLLIEVVSVRSVDESFDAARAALEELFRSDEDGTASLEAVTLLTKMFRAKRYRVHESVLNTFLSLRLLAELDVKASTDYVENPRKRRKKDREFRTKKARKDAKEMKIVETEMREADATVSYEEREKMQSETLKMVFVTYFKILKERPAGLMGATLEGLAKFAHLINVDFFGDLLVALKELIEDAAEDEDAAANSTEARNATRESLLCVITAFTLLRGQGEKMMAVDLNLFTSHLYSTLLPLSLDADIEYSARKSLRLPDPSAPDAHTSSVNVATEVEMLIRALDALFFRQNAAANPSRVAAFTKRLLLSALQMPEKSALASVGVVNKLGKKYYGKLAGLFSTEESVGDGVYRLEVDEPERSNPYAATLWETILLEKHYSPDVAEAVKGMTKGFRQTNR
ncbi:nucleolar complex-associated protein-domain-containing protein [Geopyxis carbonaria]|nr:nucleolar complex-associated protein-domain-containing protein [Geopyxis carbonaria]